MAALAYAHSVREFDSLSAECASALSIKCDESTVGHHKQSLTQSLALSSLSRSALASAIKRQPAEAEIYARHFAADIFVFASP